MANTPAQVALDLTRPIIGIENRTAQEAFDIMADRFRAYLASLSAEAGDDGQGALVERLAIPRNPGTMLQLAAIMEDRATKAEARAEAAEARVKELERRCDGCSGYECENAFQAAYDKLSDGHREIIALLHALPELSAPDLLATPPSPEPDAELVRACENILPYLRWTVGDESPGHHPTMPSAVHAFEDALRRHRKQGGAS